MKSTRNNSKLSHREQHPDRRDSHVLSLAKKKQKRRAGIQLRRLNRRKRKNRSTHVSPDTGGVKKTGSFVIHKEAKDVEIHNLDHFNSIQHDVANLYPQLLKEIDKLSPPPGGNFKGIVTEKKLWKRFIHAYARFFGNIAKACDYCGISRNHVYRARERYPSLGLFLKLIDDRFIDEIEETTKRHALLPNSVVERFFLLKAHRKETYGDGDKSQPISVEVKFNNLAAMRATSKPLEGLPNGSSQGS